MSKQKIPKVVVETLNEISEKVKEFNKTFGLKLVAKTSNNEDDYFLSIYLKNHEFELFFDINYNIDILFLDDIFTVGIRIDVLQLLWDNEVFSTIITNVKDKIEHGKPMSKTETLFAFDEFINIISNVFIPKVESRSEATIDLHDLFDIVQDNEEELTPEPNQYETKDKILPYSLKQMAVKGFQGVKETEIENIPVDTQWIFLVGENGFGKTTILQSIFLGLNGALDGNTNLLDDKSSHISIEYKSLEENVINYISDNKNPLMHLAAYGPGRLNLQGVKSENAEDRNNSVSYNLFNSDGFLFNINADLERLAYKDKKRFSLLERAICTLLPNISKVQLNKDTDQIEYIEREINNDSENITYQPLPFKKLASGFKSIIALAGDMIVRLSKNQPAVKDPSELKGIVIIDEIDLHLHPKLQKQLIGQFSKVFPKIQFIVSTHSPIPLLGAESNTVILKVNRTEAEGIKIEKVDIELKNLTPNLVLTSGIFDMEDFISVQNENIDDVRTEDSMTELEENDKVEKYLEEFEKSDEHFPDELFIPKTSK